MKFISKPEIALIFPLVFFILLACSKDDPFPEEPAIVNYNFAVSASEGGSVNSPGDSFAQNTTLTLTATADDGYEFTSWSGDASGTDNPLTVSLTSNTNITANFERIQYTLTVNIVGQGQVNQVLGDNSITSTTVEYNQGDRVTLQTNPGDNWTFSRWQGDATGYEDNFEILVDGSKTVTATFDFEVIDDLIGAWDIASDSSSDKKIVKAPNSGKDVICGFYALIFNPDYSFTLYYSLGTISGEFYIQDPTSISLKNYGSITNISFAANGISFNLELDTGCSSDISGDKDDDYDPENPPKSFLEKLDGKYFRGTWEEYEMTFTDLISFKDNLPDDFLDLYWIDEDYECILGTWNSSHIAEVIENYDDQLTFRYTSGLNFKVLGDASASPMEGTMSLRSDGTIQIAENFQDDDLDRIYILSEVTQEEFNQIIDSGYCYDIDITPPIITLNGSSTIQLNIGENWTDPGATATDDLDGDLTSSISVTGSVDASSVGTYTLTYTVADAASNTASTTRTVTVSDLVDTTPPVITLNGSSTIQLNIGENWTDPGAAATDDVDGDVTSLISITGSVDTSSVGTYTLTYSVEDAAGNSSSITRTVVVKTPELIIADYRFEGDAQDSSGNSNHGTNNGGVFTTDRFGNQNGAIYFSGASCGTRMDSDIDMSTVINEFSISFWINRTANGCQLPRIFDFYDGGNNSNDWGTAWQNGNNKYQGYDEVSNNNNWYHIVHNFNSNGTLTSFVDGVEVDSRNSGKTLPLSGDFALGRMNHPAYDAFNGKLDDVKMYNYALSQSEINVLFGNYANDTTAPTISLTGSSTINLTVGDTFTDPGATATDNVDGDITSSITTSGSVNTSTAGTYTISYSVSDAAGNTATVVQRTVIVSVASSISFVNGTCECPNATVGETATISGTTYTAVDNSTIQGEIDNGNVNLCTTLVTDMTGLFRGKSDFNTNINFWDTSNVTDISNLFYEASSFNQDLNKWDTSSVVSMFTVFLRANSFNGDISTWDTSNVTNMSGFAIWTQNFNSDISNWDVSNVTSLRNTFLGARSFNQDISGWDVSNVTDMNSTFTGASVFNQNISNWNLSSVTDMSRLFTNASAFNQDIGQWDVSNVSDMWQMFSSATNFNQDLSGWCVSNISSEPENFNLNSALTDANKPLWGKEFTVVLTTGSNSQTVTIGSAITDIVNTPTPICAGSISASASGLPSGVTLAFGNNIATISGTPGATGTFNYSIAFAGASTSEAVTGTITVNAAAVACSPQTILSADRPTNVYKRTDGTYLLRTTTDVYSSTSLSGPYSSLGFTQSSPNNTANLLGETQNGDILVASESNGLYRYSNGVWTATGLSGAGTGGNNFLRLTSGRIVVGKKGYSRKMYYSDDDGLNWSAASGDIAEDWFNIIQTNNKLFVSSAGDKNKGGIITSLDDGSSWTNLRDQKTYSMEMYNSDIYIVSEDGARGSGVYKIFKSSDDGQSWTFISECPISGGIGVLIIHDDTIIFKSNSGGDYYCKSLNDLTSDWNLFGTNEDLGTHLYENKIIDDTPLIFTTTQIMSF